MRWCDDDADDGAYGDGQSYKKGIFVDAIFRVCWTSMETARDVEKMPPHFMLTQKRAEFKFYLFTQLVKNNGIMCTGHSDAGLLI